MGIWLTASSQSLVWGGDQAATILVHSLFSYKFVLWSDGLFLSSDPYSRPGASTSNTQADEYTEIQISDEIPRLDLNSLNGDESTDMPKLPRSNDDTPSVSSYNTVRYENDPPVVNPDQQFEEIQQSLDRVIYVNVV